MPTLPVTLVQILAALGLVVIGSVVQGSIGFGLVAVIAPVLLMVNKLFLPGPMLVVTMLLASLVAWRDRRHVAWSEVTVATTGRLIGIVPAAFVMGLVSKSSYDMLFAMAVLAAVAISFGGWHLRLTTPSLLVAAVASGFISTVSAVGGPPMALVYQNEETAKIRGTLSAIFAVGTPPSLIGLWWVGRFGLSELILGLLLMPGVALGYAISHHTAARLDRRSARPVILAMVAALALVVMIRAILRV
ncbi:MAG TPA: sulfite exporter TauE/SafE family protein [Lacipirellulaceae bacterium]|nr:sulfite exporter TauE/SafE family protein [Lacipirellulaceae bacterium]